MIFFKPNKNFYTALKKILPDNAGVIEIGAGQGFLAKDMMDNGYRVYPIDLFPQYEDSYTMVYPMDAMTFPYTEGMDAVICARPCHSGFVAQSIEVALSKGVDRFIYISKECNFNIDIPDYLLNDYNCNLIIENCGEEKENLWELKKK
jgi:hypothetical protein